MTVGVFALNREAVAVAADRTVTTAAVGRQKHIRTVGKIYPLVPEPPVVVMVHGRMNLAGIPWREIAAEFRRERCRAADLPGTVTEFLRFLQGVPALSGQSTTDAWRQVLEVAASEFLDAGRPDVRSDAAGPPGQDPAHGLHRVLEEEYLRGDYLEGVDRASLRSSYQLEREVYEEISDYLLGNADGPASEAAGGSPWGDEAGLTAARNLLPAVLAFATARSTQGGHASGLVFAGFGRDDVFPAVVKVPCVTVGRERVMSARPEVTRITADRPSALLSCAQDDEVTAFRDGVDPRIAEFLSETNEQLTHYGRALQKVAGRIEDMLPADGDLDTRLPEAGELRRIRGAIDGIVAGLGQEFSSAVRDRHRISEREFAQPLLEGITHLPPRDLGALAEGLVSRAGWRYRIAANRSETVGSAADVAVLSRSEGIQWEQRG